MPYKKYKKRIEEGLSELREDNELRPPLFDRNSSAKAMGEIFQVISDINLGKDFPLARAFIDSKLDPLDPFHWNALLVMFAEVHYRDGKRGRPKTQTTEYMRQVRRDVKKTMANTGERKNSGLSKKLRKLYPERYPTLKKDSGARSLLTRAMRKSRS